MKSDEQQPDSETTAVGAPDPQQAPDGTPFGQLNLVYRPFPGDGRQHTDPSPVTIQRSETRPGGWAAVVRGEVVELPDDACRCGAPACRSGWPEGSPLTYPDREAG